MEMFLDFAELVVSLVTIILSVAQENTRKINSNGEILEWETWHGRNIDLGRGGGRGSGRTRLAWDGVGA
jgi:hypothetical protein